ncbi:GPW/gp25 family protein [Pseudoxanthomonas sp. 10H]|uniref:GPW/gp25 family protein n=1 Tax=Pseudoxanthomonas sp. 10H TaxID=3242729 RepID=UPI003556BF70
MDHLDFPYHFDGRGRTAGTGDAAHVRDLIEQVLLTAPGERVMRPDFGSGLLQLVFEPNSAPVAAATQMLVQASLQQHLAHLLAVRQVRVDNIDGTLLVGIDYQLLRDGSEQQATVRLPGGGP